MEQLKFTVTVKPAPERLQEFWDLYQIYDAQTEYQGAIYKAWGTEPEEAKKKCLDLIALDKRNAVIRKPGDVVE
ncbi:hypothetical protein LITTLEDOG_54 [Serratia phage vB_SmaS_LittleDog]|uniref:Uncharacterized protein n=1 Tax=Serratia phage vB_SmaS_Bigdog TaxID=2777364 RepID=A0A7T3TL32_9CAUD|nr:hypothetical protein QJS28_gp57 [Serratia phage vB_SmaS_Bigdog]QPX75391.1 hypothetical protein [Serratia phage vB_SmaS_Opt-148]UGO51796.1 hypothetical protein SWAIN_54 [Serratia phage vB_SmaS_Swain]UGO51860.1 hypothetical protein CARROT_54 [Serratia phage vB_SmaS_Carrot]UGO53078.1 hypothetical protein LITTLEDOG_54 [Serratia phage vB_SmaS_LittleDog]QPX75161.1 hypothetical protein BIGDOG_57 [Serratia phage vB_SmaS_Bigdog]